MVSRRDNRAEVERIFSDAFAANTVEYWTKLLDDARAPYAVVNNYTQALDDVQVTHRGVIRDLDHATSGPIKVVGPPWKMTGSQADMTAPPVLGAHQAEVLSEWLDWDEDRINEFDQG